MKLKTFNTETVGHARAARITLNRKYGYITINSAFAQKAGLKGGDQVQLHQCEENEEDWFLEKTTMHGFKLAAKKSGALGFTSKPLVDVIFRSLAYVETSGQILMGEPVDIGPKKDRRLITLITGTLINK